MGRYIHFLYNQVFVAYCLEEAKPLCHRVVSPCVTPQEAQKYTVPVVPQFSFSGKQSRISWISCFWFRIWGKDKYKDQLVKLSGHFMISWTLIKVHKGSNDRYKYSETFPTAKIESHQEPAGIRPWSRSHTSWESFSILNFYNSYWYPKEFLKIFDHFLQYFSDSHCVDVLVGKNSKTESANQNIATSV